MREVPEPRPLTGGAGMAGLELSGTLVGEDWEPGIGRVVSTGAVSENFEEFPVGTGGRLALRLPDVLGSGRAPWPPAPERNSLPADGALTLGRPTVPDWTRTNLDSSISASLPSPRISLTSKLLTMAGRFSISCSEGVRGSGASPSRTSTRVTRPTSSGGMFADSPIKSTLLWSAASSAGSSCTTKTNVSCWSTYQPYSRSCWPNVWLANAETSNTEKSKGFPSKRRIRFMSLIPVMFRSAGSRAALHLQPTNTFSRMT